MGREVKPGKTNQAMSKSMRNLTCEWICNRLPLFVGYVGDDNSKASNGEGGDLTAEERRQIERHVRGCTSCRRYRTGLEEALAALTLVAAQTPVDPEVPSIWPLLESRIAHHDASTLSRWPDSARAVTRRWLRFKAILDGGRPLRLAWMRDSLLEAVVGRKEQQLGSRRMPRLVLGSALAAAILVILIGGPFLRRQWIEAQSTIVANAEPLADPVVPPEPIDDAPPGIANLDDDRFVPAEVVAEAEPVRTKTPRRDPTGPRRPSQRPTSDSITTSNTGFPCRPIRANPSPSIESKPM